MKTNSEIIEKLEEEYRVIAVRAYEHSSEFFLSYLKENPFYGFLKEAVITGYTIRLAEESYAKGSKKFIIDSSVLSILKNKNNNKIIEIADFLNIYHLLCLGDRLKPYTYIELALMNFYLLDYLELIYKDHEKEAGDDLNECAREILFLNGLFGYCFRVAEEIITQYNKMNLISYDS